MTSHNRFWTSLLALACITLTAFLPAVVDWLPQGNTSKEYCNSRYNFCVEFPDYIFTKEEVAPNGDGIILTSEDDNIQARVSGYNNVMDWPVRAEYRDFLDLIEYENEGVEIKEIQTDFATDHFECLLEVGPQLYYENTHLIGEDFINLSMQLNRNGNWNMERTKAAFNEIQPLMKLKFQVD